jgi:hypothetical protein
MDWARPWFVAADDARKPTTVRNFGSFENLYTELVEPWLGPWAQLRETYERFKRGETTREDGARLLTHGGDRKSEKARDQGGHAHLVRRGKGMRDYTLARLDRDDPDLAARVRSGTS